MSISSIVCRGFGTFANGLLVTFGFGQPAPVGPGICGDGAIVDVGAYGAIVFSGAHDGAIINIESVGEEYA